jgi:hypothetical protein
MNPTREEALAHEHARRLAAESVDLELAPQDAQWLAEHLGSCADCAEIADEYRAIHFELSTLATPEPPRDLWMRTRAALDEVDSTTHRSRAGSRGFSTRGSLLGSSIAVAFVVLIAGASLVAQTPIARNNPASGTFAPIANGSTAGATPATGSTAQLAVVNGTSYWIYAANGVYQIKGGSSNCDPSDASCTVKSSGGQTLGTIASDSVVSAALSSNASVAAVWTTDKVAILPLTDASGTVSLDLLTPQPTVVATPTPTAKATPTSTPVAAVTPSPAPATASPTASFAILSPAPSIAAATPTTAGSTPAATATPAAPTATPAPATSAPAPATATPTAKATPVPAATGAMAILSGYEIVGRDPEFSPDGSVVAFAARPSDHSTGPDVFIWRTGDRQAHAITTSHSDLFSDWFGTKLLISEISSPKSSGGASPAPSSVQSTSYVFDPSSGDLLRIARPMLLPVVDPSGRYLVYWSGSVEFDPATGLWQPGSGDLYFDNWSNLTLVPATTPIETPTAPPTETPSPEASASMDVSAVPTVDGSPSPAVSDSPRTSASPFIESLPPSASPSPEATATPTPTPTATPTTPPSKLPQLLPVAQAAGLVKTWQVRWDVPGQHVAIWVADKGSSKVGRLDLFSVDPGTGLIDTDSPLLKAERVIATIQFDHASLLYTSAVDGKTYMQAVPELPPSSPTDGSAGASAEPGATATTVSTDRPGN